MTLANLVVHEPPTAPAPTLGGGTVVKPGLTASGTQTTLAQGQGGPRGIALDATSVYWTNRDTGTVMKRGK